jgi:glucose 1-dehydrogenase
MMTTTIPFDLSGRRALVTGASRGIGRAIAVGLARHGADVAVHYAGNARAAQETCDAIGSLGRHAIAVGADLAADNAIELIAAGTAAFGPIDVLILNASVQHYRTCLEPDRAEFDRQMIVNVRASLELDQRFVPGMVERRWGRVVSIGSVQQYRTSPMLLPYGASKAAQEHLMRNFARQLSGSGVTFNNVAPGLIETDRTDAVMRDAEKLKLWTDRIPAGRIGSPDDCVGAVLLLCSDAGSYITGIDLPVDGGLRLP